MVDLPQMRLRNQHISRHEYEKPEELIRWLVAIQAQDYVGAKWSIGLRTAGCTDRDVEQAIHDRRILRTWLMRGTLHFAAAEDIRWLVALLAPRIRAGNARRYRELELDEETLTRSSRVIESALQDGVALTRHVLFETLEASGISTQGQRGFYMLQRASLDGLMCQNGESTYIAAPHSKTRPQDESLAELARRYFASRGPATLKDFIWWSGLAASDARNGFEAVKSQLVAQVIGNQTYWALEAADTREKSSTYLLPGFDEYLLGYQDRSAVLDPQHAKKVLPGGGIFAPTIVVDGQVVGTWKRTFKKDTVKIALNLFDAAVEMDATAAQAYGTFLEMKVGEK